MACLQGESAAFSLLILFIYSDEESLILSLFLPFPLSLSLSRSLMPYFPPPPPKKVDIMQMLANANV